MLRLPPHGVIANIPLAPLLRAAMFAVKRRYPFLRVPDTNDRAHFVRHGQPQPGTGCPEYAGGWQTLIGSRGEELSGVPGAGSRIPPAA
jgi:hypothetical protein